jgi:hypothetical protein
MSEIEFISRGRYGLHDPHGMRWLAILPVEHQHAFTIHLLVQLSRIRFPFIFGFHMELEADLDCTRVVFSQPLVCLLEYILVVWS